MWIERKILMLPSENESYIVTWGKDKLNKSTYKIKDDYDIVFTMASKYQHIYVLSDEEIKEGDWCIWNNHPRKIIEDCGTLGFISKGETTFIFLDERRKDCQKIIASTDSSLNLPHPTKKWQDNFISEWNNGNKIEKILVKYDKKWDTFIDGDIADSTFEYVLKINSHNTINIK